MALELIDKLDTVEQIRDQLAALLKLESENQQKQAKAAGFPPDEYRLRVFTERSTPWDVTADRERRPTPIVNVWFDNATYQQGASNAHERQAVEGFFNIDVIGFGVSEDDPRSGGHVPGDEIAAREAHRGARLVRNILMASVNMYLQMRGVVGARWIETQTSFQPPSEAQQTRRAAGVRLVLRVRFNEFSPQYQAPRLELLTASVYRAGTGELYAAASYENQSEG